MLLLLGYEDYSLSYLAFAFLFRDKAESKVGNQSPNIGTICSYHEKLFTNKSLINFPETFCNGTDPKRELF